MLVCMCIPAIPHRNSHFPHIWPLECPVGFTLWAASCYLCIFFKRDLTVLSCPLLSSPYIYIFFKYIYLWMYSSIWVNQIFQLWHVGSSSWPQIEPGPPALRVQSLSHWTTREVPPLHIFQSFSSTMAQHKSSISPLSSLAPQVALASFSELGNTDCSVPRKWLYW